MINYSLKPINPLLGHYKAKPYKLTNSFILNRRNRPIRAIRARWTLFNAETVFLVALETDRAWGVDAREIAEPIETHST